MKIEKIIFVGLFNKLNYELDFYNSNINILTGPNGYGKTIILKSINSLINYDLAFFEKLNFKELHVLFDSLGIAIIKGHDLQIKITYGWSEEMLVFERNINDTELSKNSSFSKIEKKWKEMGLISSKRDEVTVKLSNYLSEYSVLFVKDQRIQTYIDKKNETTLISLARDLKSKINFAMAEYNRISQDLDASFPIRLFENSTKPSYSMIDDKLKGLKNIRSDYIKYGFLDDITNARFNFQDLELYKKQESAHVLELYVNDSIIKYSAFVDLTKKINLFLKFLNSKELAFKKGVVHKDFGFCLKDNESEETIELNGLSSGEQNQIIMLYNLIFLTNENTLLLIDEPEISLHVAWQKQVLNNLEEVMDINSIPQMVVATHSPMFINGNWDKTLDLYKLSNLGLN